MASGKSTSLDFLEDDKKQKNRSHPSGAPTGGKKNFQ